jgi:hypothetical protein
MKFFGNVNGIVCQWNSGADFLVFEYHNYVCLVEESAGGMEGWAGAAAGSGGRKNCILLYY